MMNSGIALDFIEKWPGPGGETWVNTVKSPIWDEKGQVIGVIGIFWDVSERLRLEKEQERSLKVNRSGLPDVFFFTHQQPKDHALSKPFLTMLFAAAMIASWGSRGIQSSTRRAFSLEVFLA